jgi:hypothetical protein
LPFGSLEYRFLIDITVGSAAIKLTICDVFNCPLRQSSPCSDSSKRPNPPTTAIPSLMMIPNLLDKIDCVGYCVKFANCIPTEVNDRISN